MAFTERYVTSGAAGGGDGSEGTPWTFAEGIANAVAGDRVNQQSDAGYSIGATVFGAGTASAAINWRGYNTSIGDLEDQGRASTGFIDTTNFPAVTITSNWTMANYVVLQNLNITGALSAALIGDVTVDKWSMVSCNVENTQNNASARCVIGDNEIMLAGSDFYCSGASHGAVADADLRVIVEGCRFRGTSSSDLLSFFSGTCDGSTFQGNANSPTGLKLLDGLEAARTAPTYSHNTFYQCGTAIEFANAAPVVAAILSHNHATDCSKWIDSLHSGTANITVVEMYNRLRDITTPRTGVEPIIFGEVTTDTGGAETDYEDAANGDFHLISGAPGRDAGLYGQDIGAYQHVDAGGGGGGTKLAGFGGGMIG